MRRSGGLQDRLAPALEAAVAARASTVNSLPLEELDILLDRASLNSDPESAIAQTRDAARARAQDLATSFAGAVLWWSA